jgi:hypothetical protein
MKTQLGTDVYLRSVSDVPGSLPVAPRIGAEAPWIGAEASGNGGATPEMGETRTRLKNSDFLILISMLVSTKLHNFKWSEKLNK